MTYHSSLCEVVLPACVSARIQHGIGGQLWCCQAGSPWRAWNEVRCLCNHSNKLGVLLEVQSEVPRLEEVLRWHGEPVKALLLPTSAFLTNRRGYPTLAKAHQELLTRFFQLGVQASGASQHCTHA